jgi:hypothetical protein
MRFVEKVAASTTSVQPQSLQPTRNTVIAMGESPKHGLALMAVKQKNGTGSLASVSHFQSQLTCYLTLSSYLRLSIVTANENVTN